MSIRGDLRIGEALRGTLREKRHPYTVMGRILLKRRNRGYLRCTRWEQWRLTGENGKEIWLETDRAAGKVMLQEPVPVKPEIDPVSLEVGRPRQHLVVSSFSGSFRYSWSWCFSRGLMMTVPFLLEAVRTSGTDRSTEVEAAAAGSA